ncbi:hypothetical protein AAFF_G00259380 [Aldrovandia affinis]|uniref:Uncharacterized protein n=1 Tax=Aldrovandia affinis TaxID=143900 RepID=A0AAD7W2X6_9TELE|nr:hypothetical protein AAFF_G00259380 [Aldrovandia affinis]
MGNSSTFSRRSMLNSMEVENLPVVERALAVWPSLLIYMEAVRTKKVPNPGTGSCDTIAAAIKDPLILAKLHFYMAIARTFTPILKRYQADEPVMPFLGRDLAEFLKSTKGERTALEFRTECAQGLSNMVLKGQEKSPLKYPVARQWRVWTPLLCAETQTVAGDR